MFNTIVLNHGYRKLTRNEYKHFQKGDSIWGENSMPEGVEMWDISDKDKALAALAKHKCTYSNQGEYFEIEEYALEYFESEDGEFIAGSDYDLAEE